MQTKLDKLNNIRQFGMEAYPEAFEIETKVEEETGIRSRHRPV